MTEYNLSGTFELDGILDDEQREYILTNVMEALPISKSLVTIEVARQYVDIDELSTEHYGYGIRLFVGAAHEVAGTLQGVYKAPSGGMSLVIDGMAHVVGMYETAELTAPVTVGVKTIDEPEDEEQDDDEDDAEDPYAGLSGRELEHVVLAELAARFEESGNAVRNLVQPVPRSDVEDVTGKMSDDEWNMTLSLVADSVVDMINPVLVSLLQTKLAAVRKAVENDG